MSAYGALLLYLAAILGFVAVMLVLNRYLGPRTAPSPAKLEPFECGAPPVDVRNVRPVPVKYYGVAVVFILFDLETVFLVLWALGARPLDATLLTVFGLFMALLVLLLAYVWRSGLLEELRS